MPLEKQNLNLNFAQGLDTKNDPFQVKPGKMLTLQNTVFSKGGLLTKRNGFGPLTSLPDTSFTDINTYEGNLIAVGNSFQFYNNQTLTWVNKGLFQPMDVQVVPMVRNSSDQITVDTAVAPNGLALTLYTNLLPSSPSAPFYQIVDSVTGHIIVPSVALPAGTGSQLAVQVLGSNFIVLFTNATGLQYIAIPIATPASPGAATTLIANVKVIGFSVFDAIVNGTTLYAAALLVSGTDIGYQALNSNLTLGGNANSTVATPLGIAMVADTTTGRVWAVWWDSVDSIIHTVNFNANMTVNLGRRSISPATPLVGNVTGAATGGVLTAFWDTSFGANSVLSSATISESGTISAVSVVARFSAVAGKAFFFAPTNTTYLLVSSGGPLQRVYYLEDVTGNIVAELAYQNAGTSGINNLPNIYINGNTVQMGYLVADQIQPINRAQGGSGTGVYAMHGINLVSFTFSNRNLTFNEIAGDHHFTGGFVWMYDGVKPVEHGFFQYPEGATAVNAAGGSQTAQQYYYYITYEWTDAAGNILRSAPSIPLAVTGAAASKTTLTIPTLRATYKRGANPVRIVIYRWSADQQIAYQVTNFNAPLLNDPTVDTVSFIDSQADSSIIGNLILYTTGGVVENISAPAAAASTLFKSRLFIVSAENRNLLWFSKQIIDKVPVEFSDLFTIFVPPTIGAQGNTGPIITISVMDDKLIVFKRNAIYYITGNGPDNTGANNDFSDPIFITGTVGCTNIKSVVLTPIGLIFQSDKGIWLLGRDLQTQYIGAPVEAFNSANVLSAQTILGVNQIRLTLDTGVTLMYDYFFEQWGSFVNIPGISTTIYQNKQTYLSTNGQSVFQETPGAYLDGTNPVLIKFATAWINLAGIQGFERAYFFQLLATWLSPHKLKIEIAYDYDPLVNQITTITPDNVLSITALEYWRIFLNRQKCQAFQVTVTESFDPAQGPAAGAGFTMSGMNLVVAAKKGRRTDAAKYSAS